MRRHDDPLVTTTLMLDAAGFPRASDILPGNVSECDTLADMIGRLGAEYDRSSRHRCAYGFRRCHGGEPDLAAGAGIRLDLREPRQAEGKLALELLTTSR